MYLFGLLYRSEASLDAMLAVCRSLRRGVASPPVWDILGYSGRRSKRLAAIEHGLDTVGWALASPVPQLERVREGDIWQAASMFLDRGTDPEPLAVALMVAHCQRGDDLEDAVDRWFLLVDAPDSAPQSFVGPGGRFEDRVWNPTASFRSGRQGNRVTLRGRNATGGLLHHRTTREAIDDGSLNMSGALKSVR